MAVRKVVRIQAEDTQKWLTTFNDLMTLLLTFFVLLLSMSSLDAQVMKDITQTMIAALGMLQQGQDTEDTLVEKLYKIEHIGKKQKIIKTLVEPSDEDTDEFSRIDEEMVPRTLLDDFVVVEEEGVRSAERDVFAQLQTFVAALDEPGISVIRNPRGLVLRLKDGILFAPGSDRVAPAGVQLLQQVGARLRQEPVRVIVEGHTDALPIRNERFGSNWQLSAARAAAVAALLVDRGGVPPTRLAVSGYADRYPVAPNDTPANRARNRRIDIVLKYGLNP